MKRDVKDNFSFTTEGTEAHGVFNLLGANYAEDADLRLRCVSDFLDADGADNADFKAALCL